MDTRIKNLDFLRGLFVFLALQEHFVYYINVLFVSFYSSEGLSQSIQNYFKPFEGQFLPVTSFTQFMLFIFVPWVSHGYIALSSFNLAKRSSIDLKKVLFTKIKIFFLIAFFFAMESFIIGTNIGEIFTIPSIVVWMLLLILIALVYSYFHFIGVFCLYIVSFFIHYMINDLGLNVQFEHYIQSIFHQGFMYDTRFENFLITSLTGFILGYMFHHIKKLSYLLYFSIINFIFAIALNFSIFQIDANNIENMFRAESTYYSNLGNLFFINGILSFVIYIMIYLEKKSLHIKLSFFNFIGINSLFVFAIHKIVFTKIMIPLLILFSYLFNIHIENGYFICAFYVFIVVSLAYFIKKSKLIEIIIGK